MKLQQLRYIFEVARHNLNVSATAEALYTSQPGVSKQIRLLEDELGIQIFTRSGKHLVDITPAGRQILDVAARVLHDSQTIKEIAKDYAHPNSGTLRLGSCPLAARHFLPNKLQQFLQEFDKVHLQMRQGEESHFADWLDLGEVDIIISLQPISSPSMVSLPCARWRYAWLTKQQKSRNGEPLLVFASDKEAEEHLHQALPSDKSNQQWLLVSSDATVVKTYVRNGWGVGLMPSIAYDQQFDSDLSLHSTESDFPGGYFYFNYRRDLHWRSFLQGFAQCISPILTPKLLERAAEHRHEAEQIALVEDQQIPLH